MGIIHAVIAWIVWFCPILITPLTIPRILSPQLVCAIASMSSPDPFVPLARRIESWITNHFIPYMNSTRQRRDKAGPPSATTGPTGPRTPRRAESPLSHRKAAH